MHGLLQCTEKILGIDPKGKYASLPLYRRLKPVRILVTFLLVNIAWILFRLPSLDVASIVFGKIFTWEGSRLFLPSNSTLGFMLISLTIVISKEICEEYFSKVQLFNNQSTIVRWSSYLMVIALIMLCGVFDSSQFIYVKF